MELIRLSEHLNEVLTEVIKNGSITISYRLDDEIYYNEIGKLMCIHYIYNENRDPKFTVQIWSEGLGESSGKTEDERMKVWCEETKQKFYEYRQSLQIQLPDISDY